MTQGDFTQPGPEAEATVRSPWFHALRLDDRDRNRPGEEFDEFDQV
jgi:hypothetical protein